MGSAADDPAAEPALGRQRAHEPAQLPAGAQRLDQPVEHLGRVAAGLGLEAGDQPEMVELVVAHARRQLREGLLDRLAEPLVVDHALELAAGRLGGLLDHDLERAHEAVAGAHRAGDDLDVVRELLREGPPLAAGPEAHEQAHRDRHRQAHHHRAARARQRGEQPADDRAAGDAQQREHSGVDVDAGDVEVFLEPVPGGAAGQAWTANAAARRSGIELVVGRTSG